MLAAHSIRKFKIKQTVLLIIALFILSMLLAGSPNADTQPDSGWEYANGDETITVYYRTLPGGNVEFKGVTTVNASLDSLLAIFSDLDNMPNWVYRTLSIVKLEQLNKNDKYLYSIHNMPFPFKKRDSIIYTTLHQDPITHVTTIHGQGKPQYIPEKEEYVRVQALESFWEFYPLDDGQIRITFQGYGEPGGSIPSSIYRSQVFRWLVEMYLWRLPYTTLSNLRREVQKDKYRQKSLPEGSDQITTK